MKPATKTLNLTIGLTVLTVLALIMTASAGRVLGKDGSLKLAWSTTGGSGGTASGGSFDLRGNNGSLLPGNLSGGGYELLTFLGTETFSTVTYNGNGNTDGTVPVDTQKYVDGQAVTTMGNSGRLMKTVYTFASWNTKPDGSGIDYVPGASLIMATESVTLYAKWILNSYTVSFDVDGGSMVSDQIVHHGNVAIEPFVSPTKTGYVFAGWYTDDAYTTPFVFSTEITSDMVLFAQWLPVSITGIAPEHTMCVGEIVTWDPQPSGGNWVWDKDYFSASGKGTFKALMRGISNITYTVNGVCYSTIVTISDAEPPKNHRSKSLMTALVVLALLIISIAIIRHRQLNPKKEL